MVKYLYLLKKINLYLIENFEVIENKIKIWKTKIDYKSERKRCNLKNSYKYGIYVLHFYKFYIIFGSLGAFFFFIMNLRIPLFNMKKSYYYFIKILYFIIIIQNSYIYIILIKSTFILIIFLKIVLSSHL